MNKTARRKTATMEALSLNTEIIRDIFTHAKPLGHNEKTANLNLGFGFLYYGLVRALRPRHILVIGSGFGFSIVCLALGLKDNDQGFLSFVDPSYSLFRHGPFKTVGGMGKWNQPEKVRDHFRRFDVEHLVRHYRLRSDQFFPDYRLLGLPPIDVAFIDGSHAFKDVRYDFMATLEHSRRNTYIFLHDTNITIREAIRHSGVKRWLNILKRAEKHFEVIDFPFSSGVALVRVLQDKAWKIAQ